MATINDLLNSADFRGAVTKGIVNSATSYAGSDVNRQRLNRQLLAIPSLLQAQTDVALTPVANTVLATLAPDGSWTQANVDAACETQLAAWAADQTDNIPAIMAGAVNTANTDLIAGGIMLAAVAALANPNTTPDTRTWIRAQVKTLDTAKDLARRAAPLILSTPQLAPFGGDLTAVPSDTIVGALLGLMPNWLAGGGS